MLQVIDSKEVAAGLFLARDSRDTSFLAEFEVTNSCVRFGCTFSPYNAIVFDNEHFQAFCLFQDLCGVSHFKAFPVADLFFDDGD